MSSVIRADAVTDWNAIAIQIIANAPCPAAPCANPPVHPGATALLDSAMVQAAVYDAVEAITGRFRPYAVHVPGASGSTAAAVAMAAHESPGERRKSIDEHVVSGATREGRRVGREAPVIGSQVPPPPLTSQRYATPYNEVKAMGARFNSARTTDQANMALFFFLNYQVLWNQAARDIATARQLSIDDSARLFALVNLAMGDAVITAWDTKLHFVFWRPLTAIEGDNDGNPATVGDPDWQPLINNPNYPDYTSGANNVTGAATRSLALFFGTDEMDLTLHTTNAIAPVQTLDYHRFSDVAHDVVNARILEGIHFRFADVQARKQGRHVAQWVFGHFLRSVDVDDHDDHDDGGRGD